MKKILSFLTISLVSLLSAQGANTPSGSSVMVITTTFAVTGRCIHISSG